MGALLSRRRNGNGDHAATLNELNSKVARLLEGQVDLQQQLRSLHMSSQEERPGRRAFPRLSYAVGTADRPSQNGLQEPQALRDEEERRDRESDPRSTVSARRVLTGQVTRVPGLRMNALSDQFHDVALSVNRPTREGRHHAFLSHNWGANQAVHARVKDIANLLRKRIAGVA